jgi:protein tyrosine phosphatase (PTP) superfamily phosphohydrolase (DUF442 family)
MKLLYVALLTVAAVGCVTSPRAADTVATNAMFQRIELQGIHNAFRATGRIFSGSQPEGDEGFAALAKLGVKTIVSVDGGQPDVEGARKHGLRYVHLPFGYDGIPTNRVTELAKLTAELSGPFFVHCHHGLHRGPAAVAIMCEASAGWTPAKAETWLREAGTSPDYPGLYRAAREFKLPSAAELPAIKELPEVTKPSSLVEAMVAIDEHFAWLKQSQKASWKTPPGHADISPPHEATLLWEQLRELARTDDAKQRPEDYRVKLNDGERATDSLRNLLKDAADNAAIDAQFKVVTQSCSACHKAHRNQ